MKLCSGLFRMFESCRWNLLVCFYGLSPTSYLISTSSALKHCNLRHFSPLQKLTVNYNSSTYFYVVSGKCPLSLCSRANWAFLVYEWYIDCVKVCVSVCVYCNGTAATEICYFTALFHGSDPVFTLVFLFPRGEQA